MITTAAVETLTAEVRVLMLGNRQVTLSVYRQLDFVPVSKIQPFGRVRSGMQRSDAWGYKEHYEIELVGSDEDGRLVRSGVASASCPEVPRRFKLPDDEQAWLQYQDEWHALVANFKRLPLIVLAGLR